MKQRISGNRRAGLSVTALWLALGLALSVGSVLGCSSDGPGLAGLSGERLRIGITPNYPPIVYRGDDGRLTGIEVELARKAAAELNRAPDFIELDWEALIPSLEAGKIDVIMSGMSITKQREERVLFTSPWMAVGQLALIRRADLARYGAPSAIYRDAARVGFVRDTTGHAFVRDKLRRASAYAFDSVADGVRSLRAHRIDFFVHDAPTIWRVALTPGEEDLMGLYQPLTDEHLAWAVALDNSPLKRQLDSALDGLRARNEIEPLLNRYIPVRIKVGK